MESLDVMRELKELRTQLSYSKNIGVFLGAGASCALGLPDVGGLTELVEEKLDGSDLKNFKSIRTDLAEERKDPAPNIEDILNQLRQIRAVTAEKKDRSYQDIDGESAKHLDTKICSHVHAILSKKEAEADIGPTKQFLAWLNTHNRDYSKEVFTTNYDLILERALEAIRIPYFDGFVGSFEPFFWPASIDTFVDRSDITQHWIRLWKIHGSLSWLWKNDGNGQRIIRGGKLADPATSGQEVVIYPSREKYSLSRKQPFVAYFDRLKNYLLNGELLVICSGYSFADQHINDIILNCLRMNNRLSLLVFFFRDDELERFHDLAFSHLNATAFGPSKGIINGRLGSWSVTDDDLKAHEKLGAFWNQEKKQISLGDFASLVRFLIGISSMRETIEAMTNAD